MGERGPDAATKTPCFSRGLPFLISRNHGQAWKNHTATLRTLLTCQPIFFQCKIPALRTTFSVWVVSSRISATPSQSMYAQLLSLHGLETTARQVQPRSVLPGTRWSPRAVQSPAYLTRRPACKTCPARMTMLSRRMGGALSGEATSKPSSDIMVRASDRPGSSLG